MEDQDINAVMPDFHSQAGAKRGDKALGRSIQRSEGRCYGCCSAGCENDAAAQLLLHLHRSVVSVLSTLYQEVCTPDLCIELQNQSAQPCTQQIFLVAQGNASQGGSISLHSNWH